MSEGMTWSNIPALALKAGHHINTVHYESQPADTGWFIYHCGKVIILLHNTATIQSYYLSNLLFTTTYNNSDTKYALRGKVSGFRSVQVERLFIFLTFWVGCHINPSLGIIQQPHQIFEENVSGFTLKTAAAAAVRTGTSLWNMREEEEEEKDEGKKQKDIQQNIPELK